MRVVRVHYGRAVTTPRGTDWAGATVPASQRRNRVQVTIRHGTDPPWERTVEDDWYATGGGRAQDDRPAARTEAALGELDDWLDRYRPEPGVYTVVVKEVTSSGLGVTWALASREWRRSA